MDAAKRIVRAASVPLRGMRDGRPRRQAQNFHESRRDISFLQPILQKALESLPAQIEFQEAGIIDE